MRVGGILWILSSSAAVTDGLLAATTLRPKKVRMWAPRKWVGRRRQQQQQQRQSPKDRAPPNLKKLKRISTRMTPSSASASLEQTSTSSSAKVHNNADADSPAVLSHTNATAIDAAAVAGAHPRRRRRPHSSAVAQWVRAKATDVLWDRLNVWSRGHHVHLTTDVRPHGPVLWNFLHTGGVLRCDADVVAVQSIWMDNLRVTQCRLEARGMELNILRLLRPMQQKIKRFPSAFDIVAHDVVLTADDLLASPWITRGLEDLVRRIWDRRAAGHLLPTLDPSTLHIDAIVIRNEGQIECRGQLRPGVAFAVRTGVVGSGHLLQFPGLEVAIGPTELLASSGPFFYVPVNPAITVELGPHAWVGNVALTPEGCLAIDKLQVTIAPDHTRALPSKYIQIPRAYGARCAIDVGRWVTRVGRFSR